MALRGPRLLGERGGDRVGLQGGAVGDSGCGAAEVQVVEFADGVGELVADDFVQHLGGCDQEVPVLGGEQVVEGRLGVGGVATAGVEARQLGGLDEVAGDCGVSAQLGDQVDVAVKPRGRLGDDGCEAGDGDVLPGGSGAGVAVVDAPDLVLDEFVGRPAAPSAATPQVITSGRQG
jgi:hypothetical protein